MPAKSAIYLDSNAGIPLLPEVKQSLRDFFDREGDLFPFNPASPHSLGQSAKRTLENSRRKVLDSLLSEQARRDPRFTHASSLVFTGSGTESNQWVIRSVLEQQFNRNQSPHWITCATEHDSVLQMVEWARSQGVRVTVLSVDSSGQPDFQSYLEALGSGATLVSLLYVNNETGVILGRPQGISSPQGAEAGVLGWVKEAHAKGALVHLDAAQAWGKLPLELDQLQADFVTFSAHKIGALAGSGALWISPRYAHGADSISGRLILGKAEAGKRGGTPSVIAAVALGVAAEIKTRALPTSSILLSTIRDRFETRLLDQFSDRVIINGRNSARVSNTSNISFVGVDGQGLVAALDLEGFAVSSGSACSSGTLEPSSVLLAMGLSPELARASLRVSFSDATVQLSQKKPELVDELIQALDRVTRRMARGSISSQHQSSRSGWSAKDSLS